MLDGEYIFPCGCPATSGGPHWGYEIDQHLPTCNTEVLAQQQRERRNAKHESAAASYKRGSAPLYRKPFSLLR